MCFQEPRAAMPPNLYLDMAESYCEAARRMLPADPLTRAPFYMVTAHAIELALKAVLLAQGDDMEAIIAFGHSLAGCRARAVRHGFTGAASPGIAEPIDLVSPGHQAQAFRYPQFPNWETPPAEDLLSAATRLTLSARNYLAERTA